MTDYCDLTRCNPHEESTYEFRHYCKKNVKYTLLTDEIKIEIVLKINDARERHEITAYIKIIPHPTRCINTRDIPGLLSSSC
jgi:hypothetical protein